MSYILHIVTPYRYPILAALSLLLIAEMAVAGVNLIPVEYVNGRSVVCYAVLGQGSLLLLWPGRRGLATAPAAHSSSTVVSSVDYPTMVGNTCRLQCKRPWVPLPLAGRGSRYARGWGASL